VGLLTSLDIGCGRVPKNPFRCEVVHGLDIDANLASNIIRVADLAVEAIPFGDGLFDVVTAYDFIEHVPRVIYNPGRRNPFIELMNEISRVLRPGGLFYSSTPAYPHPAAFQDPTHVNIITEKTFWNYFSITHKCHGRLYGYRGTLVFLGQYRKNESHLVVTMRKDVPAGAAASPFAENAFLRKYEALTGSLKLA
jgi:SAM-dependent methyltransferase